MFDEMATLHSSGTWELVPLPLDKTIFCCLWVYTVKIEPDDHIDKYGETFSNVAKLIIRIVCMSYLLHISCTRKQAKVWNMTSSSINDFIDQKYRKRI